MRARAAPSTQHYYEKVRSVIVGDAKTQDRVIQQLLNAIVGEACAVSGSLVRKNFDILADLLGSRDDVLCNAGFCNC